MSNTSSRFLLISTLLFSIWCKAQSNIAINARLIVEEKTIVINQSLTITNTSDVAWEEVYLTDWANSFANKSTPLAKRFDENYDKKFHLAKSKDRGSTRIISITDKGDFLQYTRPDKNPDILKVILRTPIPAGETRSFQLDYKVILPDTKFTGYGITKNEDYNLRFWFISPAVYDGGWQFYSNKNLNDRYFPKSNITINFSIPKDYSIVSDLDTVIQNTSYSLGDKIAMLSGADRIDAKIFLHRQELRYEAIETDFLTVVTDIQDTQVPPQIRALVIDRVAGFLTEKLGPYPHKKLLVTRLDYNENPVYGLNQLPDFIQPFPNGFQYEIKVIKTTINNYVNNTLLVNPRYDRWAREGIKVYLLQQYIDTFYPDLKAVGNLDKYWIIRQFYASKLEFNDQFNLLYVHMARLNLDQPLTTTYDSLIKYNKNIGNSYKSGSGLKYLGDFMGGDFIDSSLQKFYKEHSLKRTTSKEFENIIRESTDKDVDWFFKDYVQTREKIDFKISHTKVVGDSLLVTIKNKRKNAMPISIFGFKNDSLVSKRWVENITQEKTITYPKDSIDRFVLNYDKVIPEYNLRDNYKNPAAKFGFDKPLQFKLFQDFEDPSKSQVFFMPVFEYNIYDGFSPGLKMYNTTILTKGFRYKIEPQYGLRSKKIIGKASISYTHNLEEGSLFRVRYGISGNTFSYAPDLFYRRITPFVGMSFRTSDFRSDKRQGVFARFISVTRDNNPLALEEEPNYNVFNARYSNVNPGIVNTLNWNADFQAAKDFSKISATIFYRRLFLNNRQLNLRLFGGAFLFNNTRENGDFFSFALDRPTDYLFDYNYYGRSEASGLFSQQIIIAEGGFKSRLENSFANEWMFTANASTTIWKYIYGYGDIGLIKSIENSGKFVYDSGIQVSLLDDYFELYFPIYSNLGWEIGQPNYDQKIRFSVEISLDTVIRLFSRKWY